MAGSSVTFTYDRQGPIQVVTATCTADDGDGSFPATAIPVGVSGLIRALATNPGATAPQSNYDITLPDGDGIDILQGVGANRHTTNSERVSVIYSGTAVHPEVSKSDTLTLTLANSNVNDAISVVKIYVEGTIDPT